MDAHFFKIQMDRLAETYGSNQYRSERIKLIWREVVQFSDIWMEKTVDRFIGELRFAPLLPDFQKECAKERERLWRLMKNSEKVESKEFYKILNDHENLKNICEEIRKKLKNKI